MPAPIISPITSIHSIPLGSPWSYQPAVTPESDAATSWTASGLPPGFTINNSTGKISGVAQDEGVFLVRLVASNGSGSSTPLVFPMGVRASGLESGAALRIDIDLQTGIVGLPDSKGPLLLKSGDLLPAAVGFVDGGDLIPNPTLSLLRFFIKETDDASAIALNDGLVQEIGAGMYTRYLTFLDLTDPALRQILDEWEAAAGTRVRALAEIEWSWDEARPGFDAPAIAVRTSANFELLLYRELSPPS